MAARESSAKLGERASSADTRPGALDPAQDMARMDAGAAQSPGLVRGLDHVAAPPASGSERLPGQEVLGALEFCAQLVLERRQV